MEEVTGKRGRGRRICWLTLRNWESTEIERGRIRSHTEENWICNMLWLCC